MRNSLTYARPLVYSVWDAENGSAVFSFSSAQEPVKYRWTLFVEESHNGRQVLRIHNYESPEEMRRSYRSMLLCLRSWLHNVRLVHGSEWHQDVVKGDFALDHPFVIGK